MICLIRFLSSVFVTWSHDGEFMIAESLLKKYKTKLLKVKKNDILFHAGDAATNFYIVRSGKIKMASTSDDGREFVQGYFVDGQSFGEPPFFNHIPYPSSCIAVADSEVWACPYDSFMRLLRSNFEVHRELTEVLSGRLVYKSIMLSELAGEEPEHRLTTLIEYFRKESGVVSPAVYKVPYTRQQLADMTGMRVETVIRCVKGMEQKGILRLTDEGKILWGISSVQKTKKGRSND
jgi:CRP/FNR family cyclic AMP-dependent transcriptional regulator